ncbi:MAG: two-component regulator propeller domain-containing protein [Ferruginibacter sp.]
MLIFITTRQTNYVLLKQLDKRITLRMRYALLLIHIVLTGSAFAQANIFPDTSYTTKDGLSNNIVTCIRKDSRGFLWIATKEGLNRFDGSRFKKYFAEKNNAGSLTHNNVRDILEYQQGELLIATVNGLSVLNTLTGKFENEKITFTGLQPALGNTIHSLYKDKGGNIWVNHDGELEILDSNLHYQYRFTDLNWARHCKGTLINCEDWQTDKQNRIWFLSDTTGINIIDLQQKKVFNAKNNPEQLPYLQHDYIRSFLVDEQNNSVWYTPWGRGLVKYDMKTKRQKEILFGIPVYNETRTINSLVKTGEGNLLCFIGGKCFEVNGVTGSFKEVIMSNDGKGSASFGSTVISKMNDHQFWVGGTGIWFIENKKEIYKEIQLSTDDNRNYGECTGIFISRSGSLYCTYTNNIIVKVEKNRDSFKSYKLQNKPDNKFTAVGEDLNNHIWAGTAKGVYLFDEKNKSFSQPSSLPYELRNYTINIISNDPEGNLWIGSRDPCVLYHYIASENKFEKVDDNTISNFAVLGINARISYIVPDESGNIWMTSRLGGGILRFDKQNNTWQTYPPAGKNTEFLQKKGLIGLYADDKGHLWFSNFYGDGLICYDYKHDQIEKFTRNDGLPSDYIQNISGDKAGRMWLTTEYGIACFNPKSKHVESAISTISNFTDEEQSILDNEQHSMVITLPGRLLFVPTDTNKLIQSLPVPVIDHITVNNQPFYFDTHQHPPVFNHDQKNISIDFTAADFQNKKLRFAYKLSGVDKGWKYADMARTAQYSFLAPGKYSFEMKSGNEKDMWSQPYELLSFTIRPPWWQTWWFRILAVCVAAFMVYILLKRRIQQIKKEADLKHKIAETEMMAMRAQMNPHFIFNCINNIDALIHSNEKYKATVYLNKFAKLIRNILDSSKQNTVTLGKDLDTLQLYIDLEQFRNENKFTAEIKKEGLLEDDYKIPPLIVQPYVENAILHGLRNRVDDKGKLSVYVGILNGYIQYIIEDNGVGRHATMNGSANEKKSYGIQMSNDRIKLFNKEEIASVIITDLKQNDAAAGTRVEVLLKCK